MRCLAWLAVAGSAALITGCGSASRIVSAESTDPERQVLDLAPFEADYTVGTWTSGSTDLIETDWTITYRSAQDWSKEARRVSSPLLAPMRVWFADGILHSAPVHAAADARDASEEVEGPLRPESWLHRFDLAALRHQPGWKVERSEVGQIVVQETGRVDCEPAAADGGPAVFRCAPGATSIETVIRTTVDGDGVPMASEVRYDGTLVGFARVNALRAR